MADRFYREKAVGGSDVCHTCAAHVLVITEDLEPRIAQLEAALREAKEIVKVFHDMGVPKHAREELWQLYQQSPEMKRLNAALGSTAETKVEPRHYEPNWQPDTNGGWNCWTCGAFAADRSMVAEIEKDCTRCTSKIKGDDRG